MVWQLISRVRRERRLSEKDADGIYRGGSDNLGSLIVFSLFRVILVFTGTVRTLFHCILMTWYKTVQYLLGLFGAVIS